MLKIIRNILLIIVFPGFLYFALVLVGGLIPVNTEFNNAGKIEVFLVQNNSHTDLVLPVSNKVMDWTGIIKPEHFKDSSTSFQFLAFGWGDRNFYQTTPYWEDLQLPVAARAVFINSEAALHVSKVKKPTAGKIRSLSLNEEEYRRLSEYILKHFEFEDEKARLLNFSYGTNDAFYASNSSFHAFRTCNTWVNSGLKYAGVRSCLWTPFSYPLFWQAR